mmetsp:Transcript_27939/g.39694  ORF Transcript_27939/g.39694 Transcript_27939/m.39694 type:complete len:343 (-) Transcript_27939:212-1240(-)
MEPHLLRGYELLVNAELYMEKELQQNDVYSSIFCGAIAGICAKTCIAPAERIKMSFQVTSERFTMKKAFARFVNLVKTEGILSLWKGHSTSIIRTAPYAGFSYAFHDYAEEAFKTMLAVEQLPFFYKFLCGSIAGVGGTLLTYPLDVLRVRLAMGGTWVSSVKQGGLTQGLAPTLLGIIPYSGTCWGAKQTMLELFPTFAHRNPNIYESLVINAVAGLCGQFVTYPLDVVRRRMQIAIHKPPDNKKPNFRAVLQHLISTEGYRGMSKGFSLNVIKGPISLSISLTVYDLLRVRYSSLHTHIHTSTSTSTKLVKDNTTLSVSHSHSSHSNTIKTAEKRKDNDS